MPAKLTQKERAIALRKEGKTYNEILAVVPVAKSTLSLWLRDVGLSKPQKQHISELRRAAQRRGAAARRNARESHEAQLVEEARAQITSMTKQELLLIGTALYWAEGAKAKPHNVSQRLDFSNTDVRMLLVYLIWLRTILHVTDDRLRFSLYIHENARTRISEVKQYWATALNFKPSQIEYIYFKKHNPRTKRKNIHNTYHGILRVTVTRSTDLNRMVRGWVVGISEKCGILV